tara:strand:- start:602 stop:775 length:174 start_codon:yes stop_codon:yes gene_type:complete
MGHFDNINLSSKREPNESYENYRIRLKKQKIMIKMHLKGEVIWDSKTQGTRILTKTK